MLNLTFEKEVNQVGSQASDHSTRLKKDTSVAKTEKTRILFRGNRKRIVASREAIGAMKYKAE